MSGDRHPAEDQQPTGRESPLGGESERPVPLTRPVDACPICGGSGEVFLTQMPDFLHGTPGLFSYDRCRACQSVYQNPRVRDEDLGGIYPSDYYTHEAAPTSTGASSPATTASLRSRLRDGVRRRVQASRLGQGGGVLGRLLSGSRTIREGAFRGLIDPLLPRGGKPGRALEIGPGSGWELRLLHEAGWEVEGLEWDPVAAENAAASSGVPVHHGGIPDGLPTDANWDLIYLSHVFEHLSEPGEMWRLLVDRLRPGGRLVIVVPNPESIGARLWGRDWFAWDPPRHLCLTTRAGFMSLSASCRGQLQVRTRARISNLIHQRSRERRGAGPSAPVTRAAGMLEAVLGEVGLTVGDELVIVFDKAES